jgi:hypothetical protein
MDQRITDAYHFFQYLDQVDNDIHRSTAPLEQVLLQSLENDSVAAVNTLGYVKHTVVNLVSVPIFQSQGGIYVKKQFAKRFLSPAHTVSRARYN